MLSLAWKRRRAASIRLRMRSDAGRAASSAMGSVGLLMSVRGLLSASQSIPVLLSQPHRSGYSARMTGNEHHRTTATRPTAFLSYAREDQATAAPLARALEAAGLEVWWDTKIEGGAAFSQAIEVALESSDAVIVLWSRASIGSDWVLDEAATGRRLKKLVPVSLDGTEPPLGFRQYQAIKLAGWHGNADADQVAAIVRSVGAAAGHALHQLPHAAERAGGSGPAVTTPAAGRRHGRRLAGAAGWLAWQRGLLGVHRAASGNTVAVLPFANLSGDPSQDYFSDGLAEEVRATLARNLNLLVMAQASSARFRDRSDDAVTIAAKLGVAYLLDGTCDARANSCASRPTWSTARADSAAGRRRSIAAMRDVFAVQSEIADAVTNALVARVAPGIGSLRREARTRWLPRAARPASTAYDAYLRGRALYDLSVDEASERAALAQFDTAIAADPNYAAAHAARARSLTAIANQYGKASELDAAVRRRDRRGAARDRNRPDAGRCAFDPGLHAVPGPARRARGARAVRALARARGR